MKPCGCGGGKKFGEVVERKGKDDRASKIHGKREGDKEVGLAVEGGLAIIYFQESSFAHTSRVKLHLFIYFVQYHN